MKNRSKKGVVCWAVLFELLAIISVQGVGFLGIDDRAFLFGFEEEKALSVVADEAALLTEANIEIVSFHKDGAIDKLKKDWSNKQTGKSETALLVIAFKGADAELEVAVIKGEREEKSVSLQKDLEYLAARVSVSSATNKEALMRFFEELPTQINFARSQSESLDVVPSKADFWEGEERQNLLGRLKNSGLVVGGLTALVLIILPVYWIYRKFQPYRFPVYKYSERFGGKSSGGGNVLIE